MTAHPMRELRMVGLVIAALALFWWGMYTLAVTPVQEPKQWQFACLDVTGTPAVRGPNLQKYWMEQGTINGLDADGKRFYYRPPYGWLCVIQEVE